MANHPPATVNAVHPVHESTAQVMAQAKKNLASTGPAAKAPSKAPRPVARKVNNPNAGLDQQYKRDSTRGSMW